MRVVRSFRVFSPVFGRDEAAMEVMHAKECDTLHGADR